jgi:hypothetical protein
MLFVASKVFTPATVIPDSTDEMIHDRKALEEFGKKCWDLYEARNGLDLPTVRQGGT